ncbi:hypothetical protein CQW23_27856 [Capsicum baccatum]|uniref:Uncharacterized protein n=1 Tax=Capsicum baccatum TaxID=33114 RepID=A0A2G2VF04_CAPBA|nr:hypothetical protein CQW23_27856 [Capsicum baccatum]
MTVEQRRRQEKRDQDMANMKTQMDLLTKHLLSGKTKNVKAVVAQGRDESDYEEEANYLNNQGVSEEMPKETRVGTIMINQDIRIMIKMLMKDMMAKLLKGVEASKIGVTEVVDDIADNVIDAECKDVVETEESIHDVTPRRHQPKNSDKRKHDKKEVVEKMIPPPPPPFPQRLKKKAEDTRFSKFMTMLKQITINVPLVETLEQMPGYAKFMKDLLTKKQAVSYELADNVHHCSVIATRSLVQKKTDPGAFTIPFTFRSLDFAKTRDIDVLYIADVYYEDHKKLSIEKQLTVEPLSVVLLNFEREEVEEYEETICTLTGIRSYSHDPKKLDLDLKYASLGSGDTLPVIIATELDSDVEDNSDDDDSDDDSDVGGMTPEIEEQSD